MNDDIRQKTKEIDEIITKYLPREEGLAATVMQAMNYSINVGESVSVRCS